MLWHAYCFSEKAEAQPLLIDGNNGGVIMAQNNNKNSSGNQKTIKQKKKAIRSEKTEQWVTALIIPFIVIGLLVYHSLQDSAGSLTIYPQTFLHERFEAAQSGVNDRVGEHREHDDYYSQSSQADVTVEGIVLNDLEPVAESSVFATMIGDEGNTYAVGSARTEDSGKFRIRGNLKTLKRSVPKELVIYAKGGNKAEHLDGHITLYVDGHLQERNVKIPSWALSILPGIFFLSLWVAFVRAKQPKWKRLKHSTSVLLALLFTLSVIYAIAAGLNFVHTEGRKDEILSLGYAFLFQDSYVDGGPEEWIFSFTLPKIWSDSNPPENGVQESGSGETHRFERTKSQRHIFAFGAPLWVILLSVIGASITTVSLIVRETKETLDYENEKDRFWQRIQDIVQHQFLILFAPLGAIFVYQILVAADAVNNPSTVALAALGAGPTVNYLLARAINMSKGLVEGSNNAAEADPQKSGNIKLKNKYAAA
jgi:hypothetical protein